MEASQHALTAKSSDDIDNLQKTKVELEEQVKHLEISLQEKSEVCLRTNYTYVKICDSAQECIKLEEKLKDFGSMEESLSSITENIKVCGCVLIPTTVVACKMIL